MANSGCVTYLFNQRGIIQFPISVASSDQMLETAVEAGAVDTVSDEAHYIYCEVQDFSKVLESVSKVYGDPTESYIGWVPKEYIYLDDKLKAQKAIRFVEDLEELDDVQRVFVNYEISDSVYEALKNDVHH